MSDGAFLRGSSRREFLSRAAGTAAALSLGKKLLVPATQAPASGPVPGANERINFALIGCGGRGMGLTRGVLARAKEKADVEVVACADIYQKRKDRAAELTKVKVYHDYREVLARSDVDAVIIATPDHWHARQAIAACKAGKDVYLEKPMTYTVEEAREVAETVRRTGRILQVGSQHVSEDQYWQAKKLIAEGVIGKVLWSQASYSRNSLRGEWNYPIDPEAGPQNLDWKAFLGSAPKRPFDKERYFRWRKYWDYSGGIATDLFYHKLAPLMVAIGPEFPVRVTGHGGIYVQKDREVPDTFLLTAEYPSQHTVLLTSSMANSRGIPDVIRGNQGTIEFFGRHIVVTPEREYAEEFKKKYNADELRIETEPRSSHMENFIDCVRSRQAPVFDADTGYKVMTAIRLSVDSYRECRVKCFDPRAQREVKPMRRA